MALKNVVAAWLHDRFNSYEIVLSESSFSHGLFKQSQARHWAGESQTNAKGEEYYLQEISWMTCADLNFCGGSRGCVMAASGSSPIPGIICRVADEGVLFAIHLIHICEEVNRTPACVAQVVRWRDKKQSLLFSSPPQTSPADEWRSFQAWVIYSRCAECTSGGQMQQLLTDGVVVNSICLRAKEGWGRAVGSNQMVGGLWSDKAVCCCPSQPAAPELHGWQNQGWTATQCSL